MTLRISGTRSMTAEQAAMDLIRPYVLRGDSVEDIARSLTGCWSTDYCASVVSGRRIEVTRIGKKKVNEVFKLELVHRDILMEMEQTSLFDGPPKQKRKK